MRLKTIGTIGILFIGFIAAAQKNKDINADEERFFRFGGKAGVNINKISGTSYKTGFNYNYQLGAFVQFNLNDRFGIQPEVNFVQTSSEFTDEANVVYNDLFLDGEQKSAKLNYLEVPVLLNINVGESKHVKFQIGPAYGGLLKQSVDGLKPGVDKDIYKKGEWSAISGLWIQLPVINLGARYKLGLTNINDTEHENKWRNQAVQIFIGVTI